MVGINEAMVSSPEAPFGGVKESGLGKEVIIMIEIKNTFSSYTARLTTENNLTLHKFIGIEIWNGRVFRSEIFMLWHKR